LDLEKVAGDMTFEAASESDASWFLLRHLRNQIKKDRDTRRPAAPKTVKEYSPLAQHAIPSAQAQNPGFSKQSPLQSQ
jgi:hypothetical protein